MIRILAIACGVQFIALGVGGWLLWGQIEKTGALKLSVDALAKANEAKSNATRSRVQADSNVRSLAPDDKLRRLQPQPRSP